ncbi:hypothetical protein [Streptosporangium lutulentum]|uniref:Uncharacterized protein n=1 Tax=Streptosporangium lutulentum TaxID=1461250 RepID=A0ABT9QDM8_9ACTN|nr:hypothetical protein [Streptosporangium lutulentum]MDP9844174.1 hypothetical protein [Streptosporangium lutulentum]
MSSRIVQCKNCGKKNRVPAIAAGAAPVTELRTWVEGALASAGATAGGKDG